MTQSKIPPPAPTVTLQLRLFNVTGLPLPVPEVPEEGGGDEEPPPPPPPPELIVQVDGLAAATSSTSAGGDQFVWPKEEEETDEALSVTLERNDELYHSLSASSGCLTVELRDAATSEAIGHGSWNLNALLHEETKLSGNLQLTLTEAWAVKWEEREDKVDTFVSYEISVNELIAPMADHYNWSILSLSFSPVENIPEELAEDKYTLVLWGHSHEDAKVEEGILTWPKESYQWYCNKDFVLRLTDALNHTGGTWAYLVRKPKEGEEINGDRDKGPKNTAWVDVRSLLQPGTTKILQDLKFSDPQWADISLQLEINLRYPIVPKDPPPLADLEVLAGRRRGVQKLPVSADASLELLEGVDRAIQAFSKSYAARGELEDSPGAIEAQLALHGPTRKVLRETFRKTNGIIKDISKPFEGAERESFFSRAYADISSMVVDVMRKHDLIKEEKIESESHMHIWREARNYNIRYKRLAKEAEMSSNWDRAGKFYQTILNLEEPEDHHLGTWVDYAAFLFRSQGRDDAAEEATLQALRIANQYGLTETEHFKKASNLLILSLMQRGRCKDARARIEPRMAKDRSLPYNNVISAILAYLSGDSESAGKYLKLAAKPKEWFRALGDQAAIFEKLRLVSEIEAAGAKSDDTTQEVAAMENLLEILEYIEDLGFPILVFTVLDTPELNSGFKNYPKRVRFLEAQTYLRQRNFVALIEMLEEEGEWDTEELEHERQRFLGEAYFQTQDFDAAYSSLIQCHVPEIIQKYPVVLIRLGHILLLQKLWDRACEMFLQSLRMQITAEAWAGLAFAAYRSDKLDLAYEALCEAYWLDNDRCDVWAFLTLIHLRKENWELADASFRSTIEFAEESGDELLLEIAIEFMAAPRRGNAELAEVAARMALKLRETGQGHEVLADALALQELYEKAVLECSIAIRLLYDHPKQRERIVAKAIEWSGILNDPPLAESIHISEKLANLSLLQESEKKNEEAKKKSISSKE